MRDEIGEARLAALEREMGGKLRDLPAVQPGTALEERVMGLVRAESLSAGTARETGGPRSTGRARFSARSFLRVAAVAAGLVLIGGIGAHFLGTSQNLGGFGLLLAPAVNAASFKASDLSFRLGSDSMRGVTFELGTTLPEIGKTGIVAVYERPSLTAQDALALAESLGIEGARLLSAPGDRLAIAGAGDVNVWLDLEVGSWFYTDNSHANTSGTAGSGSATSPKTEAAARNLAIQWLASAGRLPEIGYTATVAGDEVTSGMYFVTLRPESGPDELPVVGGSPSLWVHLAGSRVVDAGGASYAEAERMEAGLVSLNAAIDALNRGEGEFLAHGFGGNAVIKKVELGYQLAYGLDYTPYLVPVAVFSGDYSAEGRPVEPFEAYVSLLRFEGGPNAGNFTLKTELPDGSPSAPSLGERPLALSESELPALARFFGAAIDTDGAIDGSSGGEITATSWDGGWLWRGEWTASATTVSPPLTTETIIAIAGEVAGKLPVLPGTLGTPEIVVEDPGYAWVRVPLLYDGIGVLALDPASISALNVQVRKTDGAVIAVNCVKPMVAGENRPVISADKAWKKLLEGDAQVTLGSYLQSIPATRFAATISRVTGVTLVAIPEHPELARNERYLLAYAFTGEAQVGDRIITFTALVAAETK